MPLTTDEVTKKAEERTAPVVTKVCDDIDAKLVLHGNVNSLCTVATNVEAVVRNRVIAIYREKGWEINYNDGNETGHFAIRKSPPRPHSQWDR